MVTSPTTNDTTVVTLPAVSAPALQDLVQRLQGGVAPEQRARVQRGVSTLFSSTILEAAEWGTYYIESSCEPGPFHPASSFTCSCPDATHRHVTCRHSYAVMLLSAM